MINKNYSVLPFHGDFNLHVWRMLLQGGVGADLRQVADASEQELELSVGSAGCVLRDFYMIIVSLQHLGKGAKEVRRKITHHAQTDRQT